MQDFSQILVLGGRPRNSKGAWLGCLQENQHFDGIMVARPVGLTLWTARNARFFKHVLHVRSLFSVLPDMNIYRSPLSLGELDACTRRYKQRPGGPKVGFWVIFEVPAGLKKTMSK